jgi:hypothetical protein
LQLKPEIKAQKNRVTGMIALTELNQLVSVSDTGTLVVSEISSGEEI